jgi:beta-lactamase class A
MDSMSTIKIPLMVEVLEQVKAGRFKLSDRYTLTAADTISGTGILKSMDAGASVTIKDLVTLMIIVSDNSATDVLYRMVGGPDAVTRRMRALGLDETRPNGDARSWFVALFAASSRADFHRANQHPFGLTTAREMGRLLEMMEMRTLVDRPSSDLMLDIMRRQVYRSRIPRYITANVDATRFTVPHKTGDFLPYIANDVGIVQGPGGPVVISIFTANHLGSGEALENAVGLVSKQIVEYFAYRR